MIDLLVTCGDSFACGSGLEDEDAFERSYAGLTAKAIGVEPVSYTHLTLPTKRNV